MKIIFTIIALMFSATSIATFVSQNLATLDFDNLEFTLSKNNTQHAPVLQRISGTIAKEKIKKHTVIQYVPVYIPIKIPVYQPIYIPQYLPLYQ